ncbi:hypothetical protein I7I53_04137 [Histoplasma capsulatum var. duboisii H88]|uniref:Uncharacterized protein n=1 Tax=Ajellomyces capsulatus (strain H88) TaxID=544711 RepID=A0A8A1LPW0_AJEC8|nr:hypothetical protein I7I53_04137 [Histoplasma capsulatum var. duboisii H88]
MKSTQIDRKARLAHAAICTFSGLHVRTTGHDFNECRICQRGRCYPRNWRSTAGDGRNAFHSAHAVYGQLRVRCLRVHMNSEGRRHRSLRRICAQWRMKKPSRAGRNAGDINCRACPAASAKRK